MPGITARSPMAFVVLILVLSCATTARRAKKVKHVFETAAAFTPAECSQIVAAALTQPQEQAVLHDGKGGAQRNVHSRDSTLTWLVRTTGQSTAARVTQCCKAVPFHKYHTHLPATYARTEVTSHWEPSPVVGRCAGLGAPLGFATNGVAASTR